MEFDDKTKTYKNKPYHDWSSHASDAFRYFAVGLALPKKKRSVTNDRFSKFKRITSRGWMIA